MRGDFTEELCEGETVQSFQLFGSGSVGEMWKRNGGGMTGSPKTLAGNAQVEYQKYIQRIPTHERGAEHPMTADEGEPVSDCQFDNNMGEWHRQLFHFDQIQERRSTEEEETGSAYQQRLESQAGSSDSDSSAKTTSSRESDDDWASLAPTTPPELEFEMQPGFGDWDDNLSLFLADMSDDGQSGTFSTRSPGSTALSETPSQTPPQTPSQTSGECWEFPSHPITPTLHSPHDTDVGWYCSTPSPRYEWLTSNPFYMANVWDQGAGVDA